MDEPEVYILRAGRLVTRGIKTYAPATVSLIKTSKGSYLVDVGSRLDGKRILNTNNGETTYKPYLKGWLSVFEVTPEDISGIILTHNHPDHDELMNALLSGIKPETPVYGSDSVYELSGDDSYQQPLTDRTELATGVEVIKLPGHENDLDQGVVVNAPEGLIVISGDSILRRSEYDNPDDFSLWPPNNENHLLKSRKKIIDLEPRLVAAGHEIFYVRDF